MPTAHTPQFTLRQLEVFLAVARFENTTAAAKALALSQSAVSATLRALEQHYALTLFDRVGKRLLLNAVGRHVRDRAESLLEHAREFERELRGHQDIGDLTLGASYTIANHLAVDYLATWLQQYPDARVDVVTGNSPDIVNQVLSHEVDVGLIEDEISHGDLELMPWLDDELLVFCSAQHPLAKRRGVLSEQDLVEARWIMREKGSGARQRFDQTFASLLPRMQLYLEFRHNEPIRRAVEQGLGIGCLSSRVLQPHFDSGALKALRLPSELTLKRRFYLCRRRGGHHRAAVSGFIDLCLAANG